MTDIEVVREALRAETPEALWSLLYENGYIDDIRAALDSLEAELAQVREEAKFRDEQSKDRYRDRNKARNRLNACEDELAQVREREVANLTALRHGVKAYNDLLEERDRLSSAFDKQTEVMVAANSLLRRYREALERIADEAIDSNECIGIALTALTGETEW